MTQVASLGDGGNRGAIAATVPVAPDPDALGVEPGPDLVARPQRREPPLW